jgi:hypothetical protein
VDGIDTTAGIVAIAAAAVALIALLVAAVALIRARRLSAEQSAVLGEHGRNDLVAHGAETRRLVDEFGVAIEEIAASLNDRMEYVEGRLAGTVSRASVIRYDAFNETSGRQSSSVALFDEGGNGVVISAILQREQARVYAKPLIGGRSELELSPEEQEAVRIAEENGQR